MEATNNFYIITDSGIVSDSNEIREYCTLKKLYKSLSLSLFNHVNTIDCPSGILIATNKENTIRNFFSQITFPIMIRLDYSTLPNKKLLGGVEVTTIEDLIKINGYINDNECLTLVHPNFKRFNNKFNVGLLFLPESNNAVFEYLGAGFDASDLRLGKINPHEIRSYNLSENKTLQIKKCTNEEYEDSRKIRINQLEKLISYQEYVNLNHKLLENLDKLDLSKTKLITEDYPPSSYKGASSFIEKQLIRFTHSFERIYNQLPKSDSYVASLSLNSNKLLLWDIYGQWYKR